MSEVKDSKHNTCARGDLAEQYEGYKDTNSVIILYNNHFNKCIHIDLTVSFFYFAAALGIYIYSETKG